MLGEVKERCTEQIQWSKNFPVPASPPVFKHSDKQRKVRFFRLPWRCNFPPEQGSHELRTLSFQRQIARDLDEFTSNVDPPFQCTHLLPTITFDKNTFHLLLDALFISFQASPLSEEVYVK
jgi:hypothetical protein